MAEQILKQLSPAQIKALDKTTLDYILNHSYHQVPKKELDKTKDFDKTKKLDKTKDFDYIISDEGWIKIWRIKINGYTKFTDELLIHLTSIKGIHQETRAGKNGRTYKYENDYVHKLVINLDKGLHSGTQNPMYPYDTHDHIILDWSPGVEQFYADLQTKLMGF